MTKIQTLSLTLILSGFFLFIHTFYSHQSIRNDDLHYAQTVSKITSGVQLDSGFVGRSYFSGYGITMERGVLGVFIICAAMMVMSLLLVYINKRRFGNHILNLPLGFASLIGFLWILFTASQVGLLGYA